MSHLAGLLNLLTLHLWAYQEGRKCIGGILLYVHCKSLWWQIYDLKDMLICSPAHKLDMEMCFFTVTWRKLHINHINANWRLKHLKPLPVSISLCLILHLRGLFENEPSAIQILECAILAKDDNKVETNEFCLYWCSNFASWKLCSYPELNNLTAIDRFAKGIYFVCVWVDCHLTIK